MAQAKHDMELALKPKAERNAAAVETALILGLERAEAILALPLEHGSQTRTDLTENSEQADAIEDLTSTLRTMTFEARERLREESRQQVEISSMPLLHSRGFVRLQNSTPCRSSCHCHTVCGTQALLNPSCLFSGTNLYISASCRTLHSAPKRLHGESDH